MPSNSLISPRKSLVLSAIFRKCKSQRRSNCLAGNFGSARDSWTSRLLPWLPRSSRLQPREPCDFSCSLSLPYLRRLEKSPRVLCSINLVFLIWLDRVYCLSEETYYLDVGNLSVTFKVIPLEEIHVYSLKGAPVMGKYFWAILLEFARSIHKYIHSDSVIKNRHTSSKYSI